MSRALSLPAPAKVNLFLRVLQKRDDGFHDIETLFQAVDLADLVTVQLVNGSGLHLEVEGADLGPVEENLAHRAARAFLDAVSVTAGLRIHLAKRIPAGAGLGGGSSDAATTLKVLNELLGRPLDGEALREIGSGLGSDVAFFLGSSTLAIGRGRGEQLEPIPALPATHLVLALPPVHVSTAEAYSRLSARGLATDGPRLHDPPASWPWVATLAHNDFQAEVADMHPEIRSALEALEMAGAEPVLLSGSGGACFGRMRHAGVARSTAEALTARLGFPCVAVETLPAFPALKRGGGFG